MHLISGHSFQTNIFPSSSELSQYKQYFKPILHQFYAQPVDKLYILFISLTKTQYVVDLLQRYGNVKSVVSNEYLIIQ